MNYQDCWTYPKAKIDKMFEELEEKTDELDEKITELPAYTVADANKVLKIKADGSGLEWAADATE